MSAVLAADPAASNDALSSSLSASATGSPHACNLAQLLAQTARLHPDRPGLIQGDRQWTPSSDLGRRGSSLP
ncbi:MAG TPA: hypothetical protein VMR43_08820, partial [Variovorax sp.]|nr:hypothetical protein [Variovorax sp.]